MFNENDLRELLDFTAPNSVLSLYLNTDPTEGSAESYKLRLRNLLKEITLVEDVEVVERYFNVEYDWTGRGIVVFSCAKHDFFRTYPLAIAVHDSIQVGDQPAVKPLANLLDNYGGYGVILIDKQGARLFSFHLGELSEQDGVMGEPVKRMKTGGASSMGGRRGGTGQAEAMDETVERNMKDAADAAARFFQDNHVRRILISGTDDNVAMFRGMLPKSWQSLIVGTFAMSMTASHADVQIKAIQIGREADIQHQKKLINALVTGAAKEQGAVIGLEETLAAINNGRVQTLVMVENLHEPGYYCEDCQFLTTNPAETCSACSGEVEEILDVVELAVARTMRHGGDVEVLYTVSDLDEKGGIGAILRY
ncbi:MAG: hypothetical protein MUO76_02875 [Anaerolineaceae bacterium]|nr:hypothetical protein [Anaerolineaceae bacterium]